MADSLPTLFPEKLTRAGLHVSTILNQIGKPVITPLQLYHIIWEMHDLPNRGGLYLRAKQPTKEEYTRLRLNLRKTGYISTDPDYGGRLIRVQTIADLPAEDIICLADPTCYISHMSAMQRWGITNRRPEALILTRPDRINIKKTYEEYIQATISQNENNPFVKNILNHPERVRNRNVQVHETRFVGQSIKNRTSEVRVSTIGQTFLDTLQNPELCGGMNHILEVWDEHANAYLEEIITSIDKASSQLTKSRAGYILSERLKISNDQVNSWKALGQRGGSRKLDPSKPFSSKYSETWMISINV